MLRAGTHCGGAQGNSHRTRRDSVPFHKVAGVEEAIQAVGASLRYLPPSSPDLNPIELLFHPLKTWLRKAAERTMEGLRVVFEVADALSLDRLGRTFDCVLDSGMFHGLSDPQRLTYERSLRAIRDDAAHDLFQQRKEETRPGGPRRIGVDEVRASLGASWDIRSARQTECDGKVFATPAKAWALELVRRAG